VDSTFKKMKKLQGKKFCFYANQCPNCKELTYISLRPHKQYLCKKCAGEFEAMKKEAGRPTNKEFDIELDEPLEFCVGEL